LVGGVMTVALATRADLAVSAIHDRNPMYVKTADGSIRNGYVIRLVNRASEPREFAIGVVGAETPRLQAVGVESDPEGRLVAQVGPDQTREIRLTATLAPARGRPTSQDIEFRIVDRTNGETAIVKDHFEAP
jgi:polyferredoxin